MDRRDDVAETLHKATIWVVATVLAVGLIWFIHYQVRMYAVANAVDRLVTGAQERQAQVQASLEEQRLRRLNAVAAERARRDAERRQAEARRQEQVRFERAFQASYEAPDGCDVWQSERHMVECVNHQMRAKRAFRASYSGTAATEPLRIQALSN